MPRKVITDLSIDGISHEGRGLATHHGKRQFVLGALPGEEVDAYLVRGRKQYNELCTTEVRNPSSKRIEARCPHYLYCGGCRLQHIDSDEQIQHKAWRLEEHLINMGECQPLRWEAPITGPVWHYRRKTRLSVRYVHKKGRLLVGFRELDGRKVADIDSCAILHPNIADCLAPISKVIEESDAVQSIPQLEWVVGSDRTACIVRHLTPLSDRDKGLWQSFSKKYTVDIYLQPSGLDSIHPLVEGTPLPHYDLPTYGLSLAFHPSYFIQINDEVNQKLIERALSWLDLKPTDRVGDFFCGLGNFSLPMASVGCEVVGFEGFDPLVRQATSNAKKHNLDDHTAFYVEDLQTEDLASRWSYGAFNKVLLDPPRTGAKDCIDLLAKIKPSRIVYVSCHTATLARDAKLLQEIGYTLSRACIADMFPQTEHVESMACFDLIN